MRGGKKGVPAGVIWGDILEVHLKKYFGIFLFFAIEKCCFNEKKGFFLGFLRFRLNSDFPKPEFMFQKGQIKKGGSII